MRKIVGLVALLLILSVTVVTVYQVGQKQKYQGKAIASCQSDFDCEEGLRCYATTVCNSGVCSPTTKECREPGYVPIPTGGFPPGPDGLWHCSGCSKIYDKTFARWASTTSDCETGIVEGSQEYTPSCKCSAPGKPVYPGSSADMCDPSKNTLYVCSGCGLYKSSIKMFVTWLSRYADCSDVIIDPSRGIEPVYTQDLSCELYAGTRPTPTPTPMPTEPFCTLSAVNNPCYFGNIFGSVSNDSCSIKIRWSTNRDIEIEFVPVGGLGGHVASSGPGTHTGGVGVSMTYPNLIVIGKINGVSMCEIEVYGVKSSGEITIPSPLPLDCEYEADGKTPICPLVCIPGSQVIGLASGCMRCEAGQTKCGGWLDACGCPGRFYCVDGRHANCYETSGDGGAPKSEGMSAKGLEGGDINNDSKVDIVDIGIIIDNYGSTNSVADVNSDGKVDIVDIGILIDNYGK